MNKKLLIVLAGPTAVGKTSLSIDLAGHLSSEIISADSRQFYREMRIGTATPSAGEQKGISHHFIGHLSVTENYNVSRFEQDAISLLDNLFKNHKIIILTGGSGLYINAVCNGIDALPDPDDSLRMDLKMNFAENGIGALQEKLKSLDPEYYDQVDKNNPNRLLRALEVCIQTGIPYSALRKNEKKPRDFGIIKIGLFRDRDELNDRINSRVDVMMSEGLEEEARNLLQFRNLNALNTVGYRELFDYFDGKTVLAEAVEKIKTNSRRYAKRQMTWFRKDTEMNWFKADCKEEIFDFADKLKQEYE